MKDLTYAMLDLKVFFLRFDNDTGEIAYTFLLNDSLQCTVENTDGSSVHGFGFKKDSAVPLYYIGAGKDGKISTRCDTLLYEEGYCPTRIIKPLQPDVIKYIRKNRAKLNPWFHMEAVRRGVFDE